MSPDEARRILGVAEYATLDDIKQAYRRAALRTHPDKAHGDAAAFSQCRRAFDRLTAVAAAPCARCDGTGLVKAYRGAIVDEQICPECWGPIGVKR